MTTAVRTIAYSQRPRVGILSLISVPRQRVLFVIAALLLCMSFVYLSLLNSVAGKGYEITALEQRLSEAQAANRGLELQIADLRSTPSIESRLTELGLVDATNVEYVSPSAAFVAAR